MRKRSTSVYCDDVPMRNKLITLKAKVVSVLQSQCTDMMLHNDEFILHEIFESSQSRLMIQSKIFLIEFKSYPNEFLFEERKAYESNAHS